MRDAGDLYSWLVHTWDGKDDALALATADQSYTWRELKQRIAVFAQVLRRQEVRPRDRIAILLEKGLDSTACMFAAMSARVTYVPLDPTAPRDRLAHIMQKARPKLVLTSAKLGIPTTGQKTVIVEEVLEPAGELPVATQGEPTDVAYIIFTSGSEGQPKGVMIDHRGMVNFAGWIASYFEKLRGQRILNIASLSFDQSVQDFVMLAVLGTPLIFLGDAKNPMALLGAIDKFKIEAISTVPNSFTFLLEGAGMAKRFNLTSLKTLILGGSPCHVAVRDKIAEVVPSVALYNLYGPTEATVYCSARVISAPETFEFDPLPLGVPVTGMDMFLIGSDGKVIDGTGEGELVIAGPQVMVGYFDDEQRTRAAMNVPARDGSQMPTYRSGDTVKRSPRGELYFVGRRDDQIKTAGYRVSLVEVENALMAHPDVVEAAVVSRADPLIENAIIGFVVASTRGADPVARLQAHLKSKLPSYMIPQHLHLRDSLPKNSSGKIDKVTLKREIQAQARAS